MRMYVWAIDIYYGGGCAVAVARNTKAARKMINHELEGDYSEQIDGDPTEIFDLPVAYTFTYGE